MLYSIEQCNVQWWPHEFPTDGIVKFTLTIYILGLLCYNIIVITQKISTYEIKWVMIDIYDI